MKDNKLIWAAIIIVVIALGLVAWKSGFFDTEKNTITSLGEAEKIVDPDQAVINIGYTSSAGDAQAAQEENSITINAIIGALEGIGLTEDDIETSYFYVNPDYDWDEGREITGYTATHSLKITTDNVDGIGEIIDAAVGAGANEIGSVQFQLKTETENNIKQELFEVAAQDARKKAEGVAEGLGVEIKGIKSAEISSFYYPPLYRAVAESAVVGGAEAIETTIEPGEMTVSVQVSVSFLI